jgi:hypothetical protein
MPLSLGGRIALKASEKEINDEKRYNILCTSLYNRILIIGFVFRAHLSQRSALD